MSEAKSTKFSFISEGLTLVGNLVVPENAKPTGVLFLHGGGVGSKERYGELQAILEENSYPSFSFDFRGVGESKGVYEESTLNKRLTDAVSAYDFFNQHVDSIVVVGTSMGAHVAVMLSVRRQTSGLILLYGAAYAKEADDKPFNKELTKILRKKDSWKSSSVFPILKQTLQPVLVTYGKSDTVVPKEIQQAYKEVLKPTDTFIELPHASHIILNATNKEEELEKQKVFQKIMEFLDTMSGTSKLIS